MPKFRVWVSKFPYNSSRVSATIMDATIGSLSPFFRRGDDGEFEMQTSCYSDMREKLIILD